MKTYILCFIIFFPENGALYEIMAKKYGTAGQAAHENIIRHTKDAIFPG